MAAESRTRLEAAVIVLNFRTPNLVEDCLRSLESQMTPGVREAIVVDNCSGDGSPQQIEQSIHRHGWENWARLVQSPVNGGFAAGNNVGVRSVDAEVYILLNSDTIVRGGALETLLDGMSDRVAIAGPRLEWPDGEGQISTFRFRTPLTELIAGGRLGSLGRRLQRHVVAREVSVRADDLDWVSFACVAVRKEVFDRVGELDEGYFMYFEDMDFCRRARAAGFRVGYEPAARVVHLRGGTSEVKRNTRHRRRRPRYYYAARSTYFVKWYGRTGWVLANVFWTVGWVLAMMRGKSTAVEREWRDVWVPPAAFRRPRRASASIMTGARGGVADA